MPNPRNDQAALDFLSTCEYHPEREGIVRAWKYNPQDHLYHEVKLCEDCGNARAIDPRASAGDPLQSDYTVAKEGIYYCGRLAYPDKGNER